MRLLTKSLRFFVFYAVLVLVVATPLLFFSIQHVIIEDADESLLLRKDRFIKRISKQPLLQDGPISMFVTEGVEIEPVKEISHLDTFYLMNGYDSLAGELVPFRVLESGILVQGNSYRIRFRDSMIDTDELIKSVVAIVLVILLLIISGLYVINRIVSKQTWKPFYFLLQELHDFRVDKKHFVKLPETRIREFNDLNNAIRDLTAKNAQLYKSQKEFTENASHEMQTPLAVLQAKTDLLMQTVPLTEEQSVLIEGIAEVNQRISSLHKNLLLLAKIENQQFSDLQEFSLNECLEAIIGQFQFQAASQNININYEFENELFLEANRYLIEIMAGNLLSNAIRHNRQGGIVTIEIMQNSLRISNTSANTRLDHSILFTRFKKQPGDTIGSGLGLQIADSIARFCGYSIVYEYMGAFHQFSILFSEK